jgi:hypothetical protein
MGCWTESCKISSVPIRYGAPAVIIPMLKNNSIEKFEFGNSSVVSNEGAWWKYTPSFFPIFGTYNDYGSIMEIVRDDNTEILESFYGLDIYKIVEILTCGRQSSGNDDCLYDLKKPREKPDWYIEGESHRDAFTRITGIKRAEIKKDYSNHIEVIDDYHKSYMNWRRNNPEWGTEYGYVDYQERYMQLLKTSIMWVHGTVYNELIKHKPKNWLDKIVDDYEELESSISKVKSKYLAIEYLKNNDIKQLRTIYNNANGYVEESDENYSKFKLKVYEDFKNTLDDDKYLLDYADFEFYIRIYEQSMWYEHHFEDLKFTCLDNVTINISENTNELSEVYFKELVINNKLKDNIINFWRFNKYMYYCGKYYDLCGMTNQGGSPAEVKRVLKAGLKTL